MSYDTLFDSLAIMDHPDEVRDLEARTYKESYEEFVKAFWDEVPGTEPLQWNWHMSVICRELEVLAQGVFQGLNRDHDTIVNISPGTSKSSLISILYPTWIWANMPNARILSASHTDDLVIDLANKSRYVIKSKRYQELFPHVQIRPDQDSKGYYANTCGGDRYTCTVAGKSPMGFHAHFLICDDPIDPKKAVSEVELKTAKDFFDNVFPSRKVNKQVSVTILVMQRLHEEDPTGHWLKKSKRQGAAKLTHIKLPAELDKNEDGTYSDKNVNPPELADNYVDGLMDPVRLPLSVLNERKTDGIYAYSGQYLQNPVPIGGGMFKTTYFAQRVKAAPYHADRVFYIDRACLVGNTLIETLNGPVPIKNVRSGDMVLTRQGYKRVKRAWKTKEVNELVSVQFANGSVLIGTGDHRVWCENQGWIDMASLMGTSYNLCIPNWRLSWRQRKSLGQLPLCSMEFLTASQQAGTTTQQCDGIRSRRSIGGTPYTEPYGDIITATSPLSMTYITRTKTGITTQSRILSALPEESTTRYTIALRSGTRQKKRIGSVLRTSRKGGRGQSTRRTSVNSVVTSSSPANPVLLSSVLEFVNREIIAEIKERSAKCVGLFIMDDLGQRPVPVNVKLFTGQVSVNYVEKSTEDNNLLREPVQKAVEQNCNGGIAVYDLEVEDAHEFFANGILVHNSTEDGGCYTAGVLLAKDKDKRLFVEWVMHGQWEPYERNQRILAAARRFRSRYGPRNEPVIHIEREGGASGKGDFQDIARLLMGFNVVEHNITGMGKKEFRAGPWSGQLAANNVWLVDNGESEGHGSSDWDIENYIQEHVLFPKGKYKDQVDASCLTPDTLVQTFRGLVRIDSVTSSDLVLTREGYRRVKWAGQTGEVYQLVSVLFSDGSKLTGTYDHPVWTQALGFVRLGELSGMDSVVTNQTFRGNVRWFEKTSMSMKILVTRGCVTEEDFQTESISGVRGSLCIEQSGRNISEVFPISMMFITRTGTHSTIRLKILNVSQSLSIDRNIERRTELRSNWHTSKEYAHWLYSGINLLREDYGISNMVKTPGLIERVNHTPAKFASVCFRQGAQYPLNTAHQLVMKRNDGQSKDVGITQKNVNYVTQTSLHKKVIKDFAVENAWQDTGFPVFNIEVDGPPEFFANNILVHNSGGLIVLSEERPAVGMRVLSTRGDRNKELRIYTTDRKELCETIIEEPSLFISLSDHFPLGNAELPPHAIQILVDSLVLQFSDIQPEDKQDNWNEIVHPYELEPEKLIMTRDHAKKLWAFITKKRSTQATAIVIQDDLDRRAISMAMGIAEILGKKPESTVFSLARADIGVGKKVAPNSHVYQMTKTGRSLVV